MRSVKIFRFLGKANRARSSSVATGAAILVFFVWRHFNSENHWLVEKHTWLFPEFQAIFPIGILLIGWPCVHLFLCRARQKPFRYLAGFAVLGCAVAVCSSLVGRALEGRVDQLKAWDDAFKLCLFLFVYSAMRLGSWQFFAVQLLIAIAATHLEKEEEIT